MALPDDLLRKMIAEAVGTFMLVFIGTGAVLAGGSYVLGFGFALIAIVYAIGNISGAHVNPAVSLGLAAVGRFPMIQVPYYWLAQVLGALLASLMLRIIHGNVMDLGATQVASGFSLLDGFLMEMLATAIFLFVIISVATDKRVHPAVPGLAIGSALLVVQLFAGGVTGGSVNPARSLAPALISGSFSDLWIYLTAPFIGAVIGVIGFEFIRGSEEGSPSKMATNLRRAVGSVQGAASRPQQARRQAPPRPDSYEVDEFEDVEAPAPPRRQQRPPRQQRPQVDPYEYEDLPPQQPQPRQQRPANYDPDASAQQQRPPSQQQRRRPPQQ